MQIKAKASLAVLLSSILATCAGPSSASTGDLQDRLDQAAARGGGVVVLERGAKVFTRDGVVVPPRVTLDLNGGELVADLHSANAAGVKLLSFSAVENGAITVRSHGTPGTQAGAHAPILVGGLLGDALLGPSLFSDPQGWRISNVTLRSDKDLVLPDGSRLGSAAVQVIGGAYDGLIEGIRVPDSDGLAGGIMLDWGAVGDVRSDDVEGTAARYRAGRAFTTHPHDIVIRDIEIGELTRRNVLREGTFGVRLSGVHDITVSRVAIARTTGAGIAHTAGDLGYEFARTHDRQRAHLGIMVEDVTVANIDSGYAVLSDSYADNVGRAATGGYSPMLTPLARTDIVVRQVRARGSDQSVGLRLDHQHGGRFERFDLADFRIGVLIDEQVHEATVSQPRLADSKQAAVIIGHPLRPPSDIQLISPRVEGRGVAALLRIDRSKRVRVRGSIVPVTVDHTARQTAITR